MPPSPEFDLDRFLKAQEAVFAGVLEELRLGWKQSHWMWFIFPQLDGLGFSPTTRYYSIKSEAEARLYLDHPVLGHRLHQCVQAILDLPDRSAREIFGSIDEMKLRSSMTLFSHVSAPDSLFARVLAKYFAGEPDEKTLQLLGSPHRSGRHS
jgi:uncharacterized protein (DUF1810 family)